MAEGQQDKTKWNKIFDDNIIPHPSFFYLHSPYAYNIHKRLFHQICTHSPFCYQDELLMCPTAAPQMCNVRQHPAHLQKNALPQTNVLISDAFSKFRADKRSATLNWSRAWHVSKMSDNECANVNISLSYSAHQGWITFTNDLMSSLHLI